MEDLQRLVAALPDSLSGSRDRLLLLVGFAGAFRRSELVALDLEDITITPDGLEVLVRRSKTDQEGTGTVKGIPFGSNPRTCPVRAFRAWIERSGITTRTLFRHVDRHGCLHAHRLSGHAIARIIKRLAKVAGLDPVQFSGHSLRAGLATAAARAGKADRTIMRQTGHRSRAMLDRYVRDADLFTDNAAAGIGL